MVLGLATGGMLTRSGTMSPRLNREEQGHTKSQTTRPKDTGEEAHNQAGLKNNYRIKFCK
jgi:hypothetical protein